MQNQHVNKQIKTNFLVVPDDGYVLIHILLGYKLTNIIIPDFIRQVALSFQVLISVGEFHIVKQ